MPPGGRGYQRHEYTESELARIVDDFIASPYGSGHDNDHQRGLLDSLLWFSSAYGPCDPLHWSPVSVEILLVDWLPRKVMADAEYLSEAPGVLRSFVAYSHEQRGIRAGLTAETLAAVDRWEPQYQEIIRSPRLQGPAAMLGAMGAPGAESWWESAGLSDVLSTDNEGWLNRAVGDEAALSRLDDQPLPDEAFDWTGVSDDIHDRVAEVLDLTDRCCNELLDTEYRTAIRRLLARVATGDPQVFRRKGRADTAAAALCWAVGKANSLFGPALFGSWGGGVMSVQEMMAHFGLTGSVSQRAHTLLKAAGIVNDSPYGEVMLGSPDLLVSTRRQELIEARDALA